MSSNLIPQPQTHLEFNDKQIAIVAADGTHWVALKPLCEALGLEYTRQFKNLKADEILSQLLAEQPTTGRDGKTYKMTCLPYRYIYGWLFSIRSSSTILQEYKLKCYDVLYDYFHGIVNQRRSLLKEKRTTQDRILELEAKFEAQEEYQELKNLYKLKKQIPSRLSKLDQSLADDQLELDL